MKRQIRLLNDMTGSRTLVLRCLFAGMSLCLPNPETAAQAVLEWAAQTPALIPPGGDESGNALVFDASGNRYLTGTFQGLADFDPGTGSLDLISAGGDDIFLAKYDAAGAYLWAFRIGGSGADGGYAIALDGSGNVYIGGSFSGSNIDFDPGAGTAYLSAADGEDIFMAKYNASGTYQWAFSIGGTGADRGQGIAISGSVLWLTGYFTGSNVDFNPGAGSALQSSAGLTDAFLARYDLSGNYQTAFKVGAVSADAGAQIALDGSGNVYWTGYFSSSNVNFNPLGTANNLSSVGGNDIFLAKYNSSGVNLWAFRVGSSQADRGQALSLDASGNVYLTGYYSGTADFDPGAGTVNLSSGAAGNIFVAKYNTSGNYQWAFQIGSSSADQGLSIVTDGSANVYVTGYFQGTADFNPGATTNNLVGSGQDIFLAKYNASGVYQWAFKIGTSQEDQGKAVAINSGGNLCITGFFRLTPDFDPGTGVAEVSAGNTQDAFLAAYTGAGAYQSVAALGRYTLGETANPKDLVCDGDGNIVVTGSFSATADFDPGPGSVQFTSVGSEDTYVAKYEPDGNLLWAFRVGNSGFDTAEGVAVDEDGNIYLTGRFAGTLDLDPGPGTANLVSSFGFSMFIAKYDAAGNFLWAQKVSSSGGSIYGYAIKVDAAGAIFVAGTFNGTVDFDPGAGIANLTNSFNSIPFLAKYNNTGAYVWAIAMDSPDAGGSATDIAFGASGQIILSGNFSGTMDFDPGAGTSNRTSAGITDFFVATYGASGNLAWAHAFGDTNFDSGNSAATDADGNIFVTGYFVGSIDFDPGPGTATLTSAGSSDVFLAAYNASGTLLWANKFGGTGPDGGVDLTTDANGDLYLSGYFNGSADFDPGAGTATLVSTGNDDVFIAQYESSGTYKDAFSISSTSGERSISINVKEAGRITAVGNFQGSADFDPGAGSTTFTALNGKDGFLSQYFLGRPETNIRGNNLSIPNGDTDPGPADHTDFGLVAVGNNFTRTFTIENTGTANLLLTGTAPDYVTLSGNSDFEVTLQPPALIPPGNSATFEITFSPTSNGIALAEVMIENNDTDENPYTFQIAANALLSFSGAIRWEHDDVSGVKDANVGLSGAGTGTETTGTAGEFLITVPYAGGNYTLKPVKNQGKLNGLSVADALAVQQHLTNINPITDPYKLIAADVNKSNSVSTLDALLINQVLLGNPAAHNLFNTSWRFVPASYALPMLPWGFPEQIDLTGVTGNQIGLNFTGIKLGDLAATYANPANFNGQAGLAPFEWWMEDQALNATGTLPVLFATGAFDNLAGLQCAFQFDPARLRFDSLKILPAIPLTPDDFGLGEVQSGVIRLAWSSAQSVDLESGDEAFRLYFTVLQTGGLLSEVLALNDTLLPGIAVNSDLEETTVTLEFSHSTATDDPEGAPRLQFLAAQPNPFVETTTLRFMMPRAGEAALRITDAAGRLLFSQTKHYPAGTQQETLWLEGTRGLLFAELVTEQGSVVQKMLAVKN